MYEKLLNASVSGSDTQRSHEGTSSSCHGGSQRRWRSSSSSGSDPGLCGSRRQLLSSASPHTRNTGGHDCGASPTASARTQRASVRSEEGSGGC